MTVISVVCPGAIVMVEDGSSEMDAAVVDASSVEGSGVGEGEDAASPQPSRTTASQ